MIPITRPELPPLEEYQALLADIWQSRMLSNFGIFAQRLERLTSDYLETPTKVVVSGDTGLTLAIAALDLPRGSTVVVPSFTFNSTVNAIIWNGLEPVFADIDDGSFNLDPASADEAAKKFGARLIVATHVFGNPADVDGLRAVADQYDARLVFDAAHGYGSVHDGAKVGSFGEAEVFSLSGTKLVTSAEGGLISTRNEELLERITYLRGYGFLGDYNAHHIGMNGKMSELHAALGMLTLARVNDAVDARFRLVRRYIENLGDVPVHFQEVRGSDRSTYKDLALLFSSSAERQAVESALARFGAQTKRYFLPTHTQVAYMNANHVNLSKTEDIHSRLLCVPLFESLPPGDVDAICEAVRASLM